MSGTTVKNVAMNRVHGQTRMGSTNVYHHIYHEKEQTMGNGSI